METLFEVSVLLDELTNLELLRKGLYRLALSVVVQGAAVAPTGFSAAPSRISSVSRGAACADSEAGCEGQALDDAAARYLSRAVYLRYIDESFDLGELVHFSFSLRDDATDGGV